MRDLHPACLTLLILGSFCTRALNTSAIVVPQDEDPLQDPLQGPGHDPRTDTEK